MHKAYVDDLEQQLSAAHAKAELAGNNADKLRELLRGRDNEIAVLRDKIAEQAKLIRCLTHLK